MPTIPLLKDRKKTPSQRKKERQSLYQRKDYRKAVDWYKRQHIWCEECLKDGIYTPGTDLHHINSPFKGDLPKEEQIRLLMDESNWVIYCRLHHQIAHGTASQKDVDAYNERIKRLKENDNE